MIPTTHNRPPLPVGLKYWDELTVAWQSTYLNQGKPADLLATTKERVNSDLQRFCPLTAPPTGMGTVEGSPVASPTS